MTRPLITKVGTRLPIDWERMGIESSNKPSDNWSERVQFSLRDVVAFIAAVSVLLAATIQLWHVGFVAACFLIGIGVGWRLRSPRITSAAAAALAVFVITYLACWVKMGDVVTMHDGVGSQTSYMNYSIHVLNTAITTFAKNHATHPDSIMDLANEESIGLMSYPNRTEWRRWEREFHYRKTADGFELIYLGRDGKLGGEGLDADLVLGDEFNRSKIRLPFSQFVYETRGSASVFIAALLASLVIGSIFFGDRQPYTFEYRNREKVYYGRLLFSIVVTMVLAVGVAGFLAWFYVETSQSGH